VILEFNIGGVHGLESIKWRKIAYCFLYLGYVTLVRALAAGVFVQSVHGKAETP
jgi:hypothetical protein